MDPILEIAHQHGIKVVEDCAQAHGARYKGRPVGSLGDVAAFSFCQDKIMTTGGEGGMLTTNIHSVWEKAWAFKDHGKSYEAVYNRQHAPGFQWLHESFGTNWRLTEMQSAIGRVQLRKLPDWRATRQTHAAFLSASLATVPGLRRTVPPSEVDHAYYKYYVFVDIAQLRTGWDRDLLMAAINAEGIPCFSGSCSEIYREKAFSSAGLGPGEALPVAHELGKTSLMFQVHPTLSGADMEDISDAIGKVMAHAVR